MVSRSRFESAWLASTAGESGLRRGSAGAVTGLLVEEGQRAVGEEVGERVEGDDRTVRWGGVVGEGSASRWLPAQGSTEEQRTGAVENLKRRFEELHLLVDEFVALLSPVGMLVGGDGEGVWGEDGVAAGEELPEAPLDRELRSSLVGVGHCEGSVEEKQVVGEDAAVSVVRPRRVRLETLVQFVEAGQQGGPGAVGTSGADSPGESRVEGAGEAEVEGEVGPGAGRAEVGK